MNKLISFLLILSSSIAFASAEIGKPAPDFTLTGSDGKTYKLSDLKGKKNVVLEWYNPGCPYVRKHYESGNMQRLQKEYTGNDVAWFSIASSVKGKEGHVANVEDAKKLADSNKMANTAILLDQKTEVAKAYGAKTTPHMYVINKKGILAYNGAIDSESTARPMKVDEYVKNASIKRYFEDALKAVRKDEKVPLAATDPYGCSVKY